MRTETPRGRLLQNVTQIPIPLVVYRARLASGRKGVDLMVLVRGLLGDVLRRRRLRQGRTLREVSADARVSLGYLSEIERGQKEASSELLASICTALDVPLSAVFAEVSEDLAREEAIVRETALVD